MLPFVHHRAEREERRVTGVDGNDIARLEKAIQALAGLARDRGEPHRFPAELEECKAGVTGRQPP
jgi:hypothetical protein